MVEPFAEPVLCELRAVEEALIQRAEKMCRQKAGPQQELRLAPVSWRLLGECMHWVP